MPVATPEAGLGDRVTFDVRDAADPVLSSTYDLAVVVEAIHDMARPVEALAADPNIAGAGRHPPRR